MHGTLPRVLFASFCRILNSCSLMQRYCHFPTNECYEFTHYNKVEEEYTTSDPQSQILSHFEP